MSVVAVDEMQEHGSSILIWKEVLIVVEENDPPMETSSIDCSSSVDFNMCTMPEGEEILIKFLHLWKLRPFCYTFGCQQFS